MHITRFIYCLILKVGNAKLTDLQHKTQPAKRQNVAAKKIYYVSQEGTNEDKRWVSNEYWAVAGDGEEAPNRNNF